jgi:hypothetical protein
MDDSYDGLLYLAIRRLLDAVVFGADSLYSGCISIPQRISRSNSVALISPLNQTPLLRRPTVATSLPYSSPPYGLASFRNSGGELFQRDLSGTTEWDYF